MDSYDVVVTVGVTGEVSTSITTSNDALEVTVSIVKRGNQE